MDFTHGYIAVENNTNVRLHFVGYPSKPSEIDKSEFIRELETDETFGLVGRTDYAIEDASQDIIDYYNDLIEELKRKSGF